MRTAFFLLLFLHLAWPYLLVGFLIFLFLDWIKTYLMR